MSMITDLEEAITKIFDCDWNADDYDPEGEMYDYAQQILEEIPGRKSSKVLSHISRDTVPTLTRFSTS